MLKVLLVDDEYIVVKGIEAMLSKQTQVSLRIFTACDAIEALKVIFDISPDVVIADINMPELDGLSMIERAQEQGFNGKFIIVSGYEKIDYLKRAIQCQVADYLLKPINKEKLIAKLCDIDLHKAQLEETVVFRLKMCMLQNEHARNVPIDPSDIRRLLPYKYIALCVLSGADEEQAKQLQSALSTYFEQILRFHQGAQIIFLLNFKTRLEPENLYQIWNMSLAEYPWNIGISPVQTVEQLIEDISRRMLSPQYFQALTELLISMLPIDPEELELVRNNSRYEPETFPSILEAIQSETGFQSYFDRLFQKASSPAMAHNKAFLEIAVCNLAIFGTRVDSRLVIQTYKYQQGKIADYHSFKHLLREILVNFWYKETSSGEKNMNYSEKIYQSIIYIRQHYTEDLSLDLLARQINLNPSYLSYMFKKEVGMTFLQYLQNIRLEKACVLLKSSPHLPIETIASQVGYMTPTYFFKIFRAQFGISPNQWRHQESESALNGI
jgi:YesN/AraC family two-component response regulator